MLVPTAVDDLVTLRLDDATVTVEKVDRVIPLPLGLEPVVEMRPLLLELEMEPGPPRLLVVVAVVTALVLRLDKRMVAVEKVEGIDAVVEMGGLMLLLLLLLTGLEATLLTAAEIDEAMGLRLDGATAAVDGAERLMLLELELELELKLELEPLATATRVDVGALRLEDAIPAVVKVDEVASRLLGVGDRAVSELEDTAADELDDIIAE